jgi:hypothetical protein
MTNQPDDGNAVKAELLGSTVPVQATGDHVPDPARLKQPLEGPGSIVRSFCIGCGQYYELTAEGAQQIIQWDDVTIPDDLKGNFLRTASCSQCDGIDPVVELVPIHSLVN